MVNINNSEYIHVVHDSVALFSPTLVTLKVIYEIMFLAMRHIVQVMRTFALIRDYSLTESWTIRDYSLIESWTIRDYSLTESWSTVCSNEAMCVYCKLWTVHREWWSITINFLAPSHLMVLFRALWFCLRSSSAAGVFLFHRSDSGMAWEENVKKLANTAEAKINDVIRERLAGHPRPAIHRHL